MALKHSYFSLWSILVLISNLSYSFASVNAAFIQKVEVPTSKDTLKSQASVDIRGFVFDNITKEPLPFCNVFIVNTLKGSTTNDNGEFNIKDAPKGQIQLMATFVGYKSFKKSLVVKGNQDINLKIFLNPDEESLHEVQVKGDKDRKWSRQYSKFEKEFLGQSVSTKNCNILNPWILEFEGQRTGLKLLQIFPWKLKIKYWAISSLIT